MIKTGWDFFPLHISTLKILKDCSKPFHLLEPLVDTADSLDQSEELRSRRVSLFGPSKVFSCDVGKQGSILLAGDYISYVDIRLDRRYRALSGHKSPP